MPSALNTGVPLAGGTVNSPGYERQPENLLFGPLSSSTLSHKFNVHESPILLRAFGLISGAANNVYVVMVTEQNNGIELQEVLFINDSAVALTSSRNAVLIDLPGIYRLKTFSTEALGQFYVTAQQTSMSYWSYGLASYGASVGTTAPVNPP